MTIALMALVSGCDQGGLEGPQAQVRKTNIKLDLPGVPEFQMPTPYPDGSHSVRELQLKGRALFETELKVKGFVIWIYDCLAHKRKPDQTDKQAAKMITEDPSLCDRPHFVLGDSADTPSDKGIWVVEVPRELRKDEKKTYTKEELAEMPPVPVFSIGDEVVVTGTWDIQSPKGFANSNGLLVYKEMENLSSGSPEDGAE